MIRKNFYFCTACQEETIEIFVNEACGVSICCHGKNCEVAISFLPVDVIHHIGDITDDLRAAAHEALEAQRSKSSSTKQSAE